MTVGIVVVAHSQPLAQAAAELALAMNPAASPYITIAAGVGPTAFGTDVATIATAITNAHHGHGVVVLTDIDSTTLAAQSALDVLDADIRQRTFLCPAPLVEGLIEASIAASSGQPVTLVAEQACNALESKISRLESTIGTPPAYIFAPDEITGSFIVGNAHGLHIRPAAEFVKTATVLDTQVMIRNRSAGSAWVPANSLSKVTSLAIQHGDEIELCATGAEANEVVYDLLALAARNFGEKPHVEDDALEADCQ